MSRYDDLPKMTIEELESELNFYQFLEDNKTKMDSKDAVRNKLWLDALWIEIKRREYDYEIKLIDTKECPF